MSFFEKFRTEIARYAEGVHHLGAAASAAAVRGLPAELAQFLRSWNGAELFIDAVVIDEAASVVREGDRVFFGRTSNGDRLALDDAGRVIRLEEDSGDELIEGTRFARWIEGWVTAESVIYDREGEFREDVFDDSGEELTPEASERRERKALKVDPTAPAPAWRLARALARLDRPDKAMKVLSELVATTPKFGWAWYDLGRLERGAGNLDRAEAAFAAAADADPDYEHAGYFLAHAARVASARGADPVRATHAARALAAAPDLARRQREAAAALLSEGHAAEALEAAELAVALAPKDLESLSILRRARG